MADLDLTLSADGGGELVEKRDAMPPDPDAADVELVEERLREEKRRLAIEELREFRSGRTLGGLSIREMIDEGRR